MKRIVILIFHVYSIIGYTQEPIIWTYGSTEITFEDTSDNKYIGFDTTGVWQIAIPQKEILSMTTKAIFADTNIYYENNLKASFHFKLILGPADEYELRFYHKYDFEKNKDGGIIETSYDNGITWQNFLLDTLIHPSSITGPVDFYDLLDTIISYNNHPGFTNLHSDLIKSSCHFTIDDGIKGDTMLLRFTIASDNVDSTNEGWMLDNFLFTGFKTDNVNELKGKSVPNIYPNPAYSILYIESETEQIDRIELISLTGQILLSYYGQNITSIDISNIQSGLYFIICTNSKRQNAILKIIKI